MKHIKPLYLSFFLTFLLIVIQGSTANNNDCMVHDFRDSTRSQSDYYTESGFKYFLKDTCQDSFIDSIIIKSGISITSSGHYFGIDCTEDSCSLMIIKIKPNGYLFDTLFIWDNTNGIDLENNLVTILYSDKDSIFVFRDYEEKNNSKKNGSFITKIISKHNLDTLAFIPYTRIVFPPTFSDDLSQIFFTQVREDNNIDIKNSYTDLVVYDIKKDTSYNPFPSNDGHIYFSFRMNRESYIYFLKVGNSGKMNLYRVKENHPEEQLTFLKGDYVFEDVILNSDTSLTYIVTHISKDSSITDTVMLEMTN